MRNFKAREVRKPVIEHLLNIGYYTDVTVDELVDSPYVTCYDKNIFPQVSVKYFKDYNGSELNEIQLLKLQPELEIKKEDKLYQLAKKLVKYLNSNKIKNSDGYDQIFTVQKPAYDMLSNKWEVLPISPNACGNISGDKMKIIMDWLNNKISFGDGYSFSYTDYNDNKKRYGTSKPCIRLC